MSEFHPISQWVFPISLHLIALFGILVLWLTAICARGIRRHPTWYSFVIAWNFWSFSWAVLAFTGQLNSGTNVPHSVCLAQASLVYAAPVLTSTATLSFVTHTWLVLRGIVAKGPMKMRQRTMILLLAVPYALWLPTTLLILAYGLQNPATVGRLNPIQCVVRAPDLLMKLPFGIGSVASAATLFLQAVIGYYLLRYNKTIAGSQEYGPIIRVLLFAALVLIGIVAQISTLVDEQVYNSEWVAVVTAILAPSGLLIFGSQMDLLRMWMFWIPRRVDQQKGQGQL